MLLAKICKYCNKNKPSFGKQREECCTLKDDLNNIYRYFQEMRSEAPTSCPTDIFGNNWC